MKIKGWFSMDSAPKDGTEILVIETPNGEHYNVLLAAWMAYKRDPDYVEFAKRNDQDGRWWGVCLSKMSSEGPLYTRWKPLAITPTCWKFLPRNKLTKKEIELFNKIAYAN